MSIVINALVAACKDKSCAPPPVGTGGSRSSGANAAAADELRKASWAKIEEANADLRLDDREMMNALEARSWYTGFGSSTINPYLRNGDLGSNLDQVDEEFVKTKVREMDEAFDRFGVTVETPIEVGRGMVMEGWWADDVLEAFRVGSVAYDRGYVSTTSTPKIADVYSYRNMYQEPDPDNEWSDTPLTGVDVRITVPKGTRVLAGTVYEGELILPRDLKYRVVSARKTSRRFVELHMEVVL